MAIGRPSKYKMFDNKEWLYEQYCVKGMSTCQIAALVGADPQIVRYRLCKFSIPLRNLSLSHTHNRKDLVLPDREVLDGNLLGDGSLLLRNKKTGQGLPSYSQAASVRDHVEYVGSLLWRGNVSSRIGKGVTKGFTKKSPGYVYFKFTTTTSPSLLPFYERWYPSSEKTIPKDLSLTSVSLLHWFLGDGTCSYKKERPKEQRSMVLCSESFTKEENEWLCSRLESIFNIKCNTIGNAEKGTDCRIRIRQESIDRFFDIIGPPPVPSLAYKWKTMR